MKKKILIFSAGSTGREIFQLITAINKFNDEWEVVGYVDDNKSKINKTVDGIQVYSNEKKPKNKGTKWEVALWGNSARIYKTKIKNRIDENGQMWEGVKEFKIGAGHKLNPKTKKKLSKFRNGVKTIDRYAEIQSLPELQGIN